MDDKRKFTMILATPNDSIAVNGLTDKDFDELVRAFYDLAKDGGEEAVVSLSEDAAFVVIKEEGI